MPASDRAKRLHAVAVGFRDYLQSQTDIELPDLGAVDRGNGHDALVMAVERIDLALGQMIDLATVYTDDARMSLEPLTVPTAALVGEYLRATLSATWLADEDDTARMDDALVIVLPNGIAADLTGVARSALLSGAPNFAAVITSLIGNDTVSASS